jgi:hypothetical protein
MHTHKKWGPREELRTGHPVQYLNKISHGQNLNSPSGEPEFVAQKFLAIPASVHVIIYPEYICKNLRS